MDNDTIIAVLDRVRADLDKIQAELVTWETPVIAAISDVTIEVE